MSVLPDAALVVVARIEALLDEAGRLLERTGIADERAYALRETERRYLPDTLGAYLDIPASRRDAESERLLLEQLGVIERATAAQLQALAQAGESALAANGAFLAERFADRERLPAAPNAPSEIPPTVAVAELSAPRALVARFFSDLDGPSRSDPALMLQLAGQRFATVFPALTTVKRGLFGGPVKSVAVDVPRGADVLRYSLEIDRGGVAAVCTKIVRGVALRNERVDLGQWMRGLLEDVGAYVERDRAARDLLTRFLSG